MNLKREEISNRKFQSVLKVEILKVKKKIYFLQNQESTKNEQLDDIDTK